MTVFLHITPQGIPLLTWGAVIWLTAFFILVGFLAPFVHALAQWAIANSKRGQARRAAELPEIARRRIAELSQRALEAEDREKRLQARYDELIELHAAELNFHANHDARVRLVAGGKG